jgi:hypothetical protein
VDTWKDCIRLVRDPEGVEGKIWLVVLTVTCSDCAIAPLRQWLYDGRAVTIDIRFRTSTCKKSCITIYDNGTRYLLKKCALARTVQYAVAVQDERENPSSS